MNVLISAPRTLLKWTLFAVVLAYVCRHGYSLWHQSDDRAPLTPASSAWLLLSAVLYVVSWLPSVWFWRELMRALGGRPDFAAAARAYYCGSLGKYVPGKAMVLVLRGSSDEWSRLHGTNGRHHGRLRNIDDDGDGAPRRPGLGPFARMGTGARSTLVGAGGRVGRARPDSLSCAALVLGRREDVAARSVLSWTTQPRATGTAVASRDRLVIPTWLVGAGCAAFLISWAIQGLSLGVTLHAVDQPLDWAEWPVWSGAMALSTSLGFAMLFRAGRTRGAGRHSARHPHAGGRRLARGHRRHRAVAVGVVRFGCSWSQACSIRHFAGEWFRPAPRSRSKMKRCCPLSFPS